MPLGTHDDDRYSDPVDEAALNLDRASHGIVVIARGAMEKIISLGWKRVSVRMEVPSDDPLPCWVTLRGRRVFEIRLIPYDDGRINVQGEWIDSVPAPTFLDRFMGH